MTLFIYALFALLAIITPDVQAGQWTPQVELEGTWSESPFVAVDADGNAVAVWLHYDEEHAWIKGAFKRIGESWSAPLFLTEAAAPVKSLGSPQVKFDTQGNAIAFWNSFDGEKTTVQMAITVGNTGVWYEFPTPFSSPPRSSMSPKVDFAIEQDGTVLVVWNPTTYDKVDIIESARLSVENEWSPIEQIVCQHAIEFLSLGLDPAGNAVLVWSEDRSHFVYSDTVVATTLLKDATSWSTPSVLSSGSQTWFSQVAVDDSGNALAIWQELDSAEEQWSINSAILPFGATSWTQMQVPDSVAPKNWFRDYCSLKMDGAGNAIVLWKYNIFRLSPLKSSRFSFKDGLWTTPIDVLPKNDPRDESFAIDKDGNAIFIWQEYDQNLLQAVTLSAKSNSQWTKPATIATIHSLGSWPSTAFSPDGSCHIVYCDDFYPAYSVKAIVGSPFSKGARR